MMEQLEVAEVAIDEGALAWRGQMYEEVAKVQQVVGAIVLIVRVVLEVESGRKVVQVSGGIYSQIIQESESNFCVFFLASC